MGDANCITTVRRDSNLFIKVSPAEKGRYREAASRHGLPLSDWVRRQLDAALRDEEQ